MRIGLLADVHEDVQRLGRALERLRGEGVDRLVLLGDVFDMGRCLEETVAVLAEAGVIGVWGNHELGLCHEPDEHARQKYSRAVLDFMATLRPRLELEDCLFTHGLPCWDATDPVIYYLGTRPEEPAGLAACFQAVPHRVLFVGHFHRWLIATPREHLAWSGAGPICLHPEERYFVIVAAVCDGWCALFDTGSGWLTPYRLS
jgi:predicted phosphodiesterase